MAYAQKAAKTAKMKKIEESLELPIETVLAQNIPELGLKGTAEALEVSETTIWLWLQRLGLRIEARVLRHDQKILVFEDIKKGDDNQ